MFKKQNEDDYFHSMAEKKLKTYKNGKKKEKNGRSDVTHEIKALIDVFSYQRVGS